MIRLRRRQGHRRDRSSFTIYNQAPRSTKAPERIAFIIFEQASVNIAVYCTYMGTAVWLAGYSTPEKAGLVDRLHLLTDLLVFLVEKGHLIYR